MFLGPPDNAALKSDFVLLWKSVHGQDRNVKEQFVWEHIVASTGKVKILWKEQITGKTKMEKIYAYNFHICEGTINAECIYI